MIVVEPGRIWADWDPRCPGRRIRVDRIEDGPRGRVAVCTVVAEKTGSIRPAGRPVRIAVGRFTPANYRLLP